MLLSDLLLEMPVVTILVHLLTILLLAFGLSGLSVGISAWLPNFRETDPSKVVLGFGGTVNMLVGLGYLVFIIAVACGPYHAASAVDAFAVDRSGLAWWSFAGLPFAAAGAACATMIPMRFGAANLRTVEF
jgi:ABC-2 type transport system permease protein